MVPWVNFNIHYFFLGKKKDFFRSVPSHKDKKKSCFENGLLNGTTKLQLFFFMALASLQKNKQKKRSLEPLFLIVYLLLYLELTKYVLSK